MKPEDIGLVMTVGEPRVSPDGSQVAYTVATVDLDANAYRSRIWLAPADGSAPPRPFTSGAHRDVHPRWSPDGRSLAFVSHRSEGSANCSDIFVIPVGAGGEAVRAATWPEEVDELTWSPDGTTLAFATRLRDEAVYKPERDADRPPRRIRRFEYRLDNVGWTIDRPRRLFVVAADGSSAPRCVHGGEIGDAPDYGGLAWSPDGAALAFSAGLHATWDADGVQDIYRVEVAAGATDEARRLTPGGARYTRPSWSGDGRRVAFVKGVPRSLPRNNHIGVVPPDGSGPPVLLTTALDRHCANYLAGGREPAWDGRWLWFQLDDGGNTHLYKVDATARDPKPELVVGGEITVGAFDVAGGTLAFVASRSPALGELHVQTATSSWQTNHGTAFAAAVPTSRSVRFAVTAPDGTEIDAWVMPPAGAVAGKRYPALLNIHGGPFTQYGTGFFDEFQIQAGAGYAVIYCNPRGSSGRSEAFARAIRGPKAAEDPGTGWGGVDAEDVLAVVEAAAARFDFIDRRRIGVLGGSYGGYLTSWLVGHTNRFRAACSERAVNNVLTMTWTSDIGHWFNADYAGVDWLTDPKELLRQSPVTYADDIHTPLLILHSENDLRCPISQGEEMFVRLRALGREVEFVRFPGSSHELSRSGAPRLRVERARIILDWFDRHLRRPAARTSGPKRAAPRRVSAKRAPAPAKRAPRSRRSCT